MINKATIMVVAGLAFAASASAAIWTETGDAGNLPGTAQTPAGSGVLDAINGATGGQDFVDMYSIAIDSSGSFSASTVGGAAFDTQLFLFDSAGLLVAFNDDSGSLQSTISGAFAAGNYFIAVDGFNNDPVGDPVTGWTGGGSTGAYTIAFTGATFKVPTPGAIGLFGIAGLAATRRRRA